MDWFEKPQSMPGRSRENHDRTEVDRSSDRILNPGPPEYDVLVLTGDHSTSLSSP